MASPGPPTQIGAAKSSWIGAVTTALGGGSSAETPESPPRSLAAFLFVAARLSSLAGSRTVEPSAKSDPDAAGNLRRRKRCAQAVPLCR